MCVCMCWYRQVHPQGNGPHFGTSLSAFLALTTPVSAWTEVLMPFSMSVVRTDGGDPGRNIFHGSDGKEFTFDAER